MPGDRRGIPRREFVKTALAIGGTSALTACMDRSEASNGDDFGVPQGVEDVSELPRRQHAWSEFEVRDPNGNTIIPQHQLLLFYDYVGDGPTEDERRQVEAAMRTTEHAFQWGTWHNDSAVTHEGVLSMLGYSAGFFKDVYGERPAGVDLWDPQRVIDRLGESGTATPDPHDAVLVLNSDYPRVLLGIEEALKGNRDSLNGVDVEDDFAGVLAQQSRRTGFVGKGLPADRFENEDIPEDAPLSMGFKSGFSDNQPSEDGVTIQEGAFAQGTTIAASRLLLKLDRWYDNTDEERVDKMFAPEYSAEQTGPTAQRLGGDSELTEGMVEDLPEDARERGCVGHSQKTARARDDGFDPLIFRRSEGNSTDLAEPSMNFSSIQRATNDFVVTREAMSNEDFEDEVHAEDSGIVDYIEPVKRGFYLVPPRSDRALPAPGR